MKSGLFLVVKKKQKEIKLKQKRAKRGNENFSNYMSNRKEIKNKKRIIFYFVF